MTNDTFELWCHTAHFSYWSYSCRLSALVWRLFLFYWPGHHRGFLTDPCVFLMTCRTVAWTNYHKAIMPRMH